MSERDAISLFKAIDHDGNRVLSLDEISVELATINCALIMASISKIAQTSKTKVKELY